MMVSYYQDWASQLLEDYLRTNPWIPCTSVICGIFACKIVYDLSQLISVSCFKNYCSLPKMKQIEWNNRAISTVHAIFIMAFSIYLVFWSDIYADDQQRGPALSRSSPLSTFVLGVSVGYFISDIGMILWFYPAIGGMEYVLHHLLSMAALVYAMLTGDGQVYTYMTLISETTTPGINLRWYLDAAGLKRSKAYVVNGVAIFLTWMVARILLFMYVFYYMYSHYDEIKQLPSFGFFLITTAPTVLAVLNVMWFSKITKGMIKTLATKRD